jgi:hypothetical protein
LGRPISRNTHCFIDRSLPKDALGIIIFKSFFKLA